MKSQYRSNKSVAKNPTVPIAADDPRLAWNKKQTTKSRQGAEIEEFGLDGKSLVQGGIGLNGLGLPSSSKGTENVTILPPMGGEPPKVYPGGSGPFVIIPTDPTNVTAVWSGEDLVVSFDWDYANELNITVSHFVLELMVDGITKRTPLNAFPVNKTQSAQTVTLTKALNTQTFGLYRTNINSICVLTTDPLNNVSQPVCVSSVPVYVLDLPIPTISVTSINNGYSVSYVQPTQGSFNSIEIVEYESNSSTEPIGVTYSRTYLGTINPANIIVHNFNTRWVKARFTSDGGTVTSYCNAIAVTPTSPVSVDNTPPGEVTQVQASWSGDNINLSYKLPSQDQGIRVQIQLTAPNNLVGYFYRFPDGSGRDQTTTITKKDLFDQFGEHYSSFTGILKSIDASDNRTSGVSFNVPARTNPLAGITPTFTTVGLSNAYSVNFTLPVGAVFGEVYAKHTAWSGDPIDDTYVVYAGLSPAVVVDTDYTTVYIKIRYYDDFGNTSNYSAEGTVTPLNPGEITSFENPITFGENAVIYAGNSPTTGTRTLFKTGGIFAYDATNTSPSTQIVSNASAGTPTFITTQAQIADWNVTDTKIENTLLGAPTKYTGLSATGTYAFWAGSDTSGGDSSANFTVTPTGIVKAKNISILGNGTTDDLMNIAGLFKVKNDGSFTATGADISGKITATSGEFTGNVKLNGGALYALGSGGTASSGIRTIFNSSGIAAYNASGGYTAMLTTPLANGAIFTTNAADIGGWLVDSDKIYKTSISGKGNIEIDSTNGYISVSNSNISDYRAGINSPGNNLNDNVFWAGTGGPTSASNPFRVTLGGKLYATGADISGTVSSIGALGTMTMDGTEGYMSLSTASNNAKSYLVPRNGNIYLTSPSTTEPWTSGSNKPIASTGPVSGTYFSAGASFKDPWSNTANGIGLFTGSWDYFATGSSSPFISLTKNAAGKGGIQLSASPKIGMIIEEGGSIGDAFTEPTMLLYTANNGSGSSYSPSTEYGAWLKFSENNIIIQSGASNVLGSGIGQNLEAPRAYDGPSRISLDPTNGVVISGIRVQGNIDMNNWEATGEAIIPAAGTRYHPYADDSYYIIADGVGQVYPNGSYRNAPPLGRYPRQRMMVEDPATGEMMLGMAIYYKPVINGVTPPLSNTGYAGDILVQY